MKKKENNSKSGLILGAVSCSEFASRFKADPLDVSSGCGDKLHSFNLLSSKQEHHKLKKTKQKKNP